MAGTNYAVVIAVESYQQPSIHTVEYARADANAMAEVLITRLGVPKENMSLWTDHDATQNRLRNEIPYEVGQLGPDDRFIFFYAGHGFYAEGANRIATWDTHPSNLAGTTTCLDEVLLSPLRKSRCQKSLVFIDACAANLWDTVGFRRDVIAGMNREEFNAFVQSSEYAAAFFSCSPAERSYSSPLLQHGIWTHHLLCALRGEAKDAVHKDGSITGESLKTYLSIEIPKFIREKTRLQARQRPYALIGSNGAFEIVRIPKPVVMTSLPKLKLNFAGAYFRGRQTREYRNLEGFDRKRGHTAPTARSDSADTWAGRLLHDEMVQELESIQENAKTVLKLKRREIHMDWSPFLRQTVRTHFSSNGELSHGIVTQAVHTGV